MVYSRFSMKLFFTLVFIHLTTHLLSQTVAFKSVEDSSELNVTVFVFHGEEKVKELKSIEGIIDFSSIKTGQFVEIFATGHEEMSFEKIDKIPSVIYLHKIAKRFDEMVITGQMR